MTSQNSQSGLFIVLNLMLMIDLLHDKQPDLFSNYKPVLRMVVRLLTKSHFLSVAFWFLLNTSIELVLTDSTNQNLRFKAAL